MNNVLESTPVATHSPVSCPRCLAALAACPTNEHGFPLASQAFAVGNMSRIEMGHQMFRVAAGRVAICHADRR